MRMMSPKQQNRECYIDDWNLLYTHRTCSRTGSIMMASLLAESARMYVNVLDPESNSWRNSSGAGAEAASVTMLLAVA